MSETDAGTSESRQVFFDELCSRRHYFLGLFSFALIFLVLQFPYLVVLDADSGLFVIATLNVVGSGAFAVGFGSVLWVCRQRDV